MHEIVKWYIASFIALFLLFSFLLRKKISYIFCPLQKYTGKSSRGKSMYFMMVHLFSVLMLSVVTFLFIADIPAIELIFANSFIRIASFILLMSVWSVIVGLLIEMYLEVTDQEYKDWKADYLRKH